MAAALLLSLLSCPALLAGPAKLAASPSASPATIKRAAAPAMQVMQAGPMTPARAMVYESQQRAYWNPMTSEAELYGGFGGYGPWRGGYGYGGGGYGYGGFGMSGMYGMGGYGGYMGYRRGSGYMPHGGWGYGGGYGGYGGYGGGWGYGGYGRGMMGRQNAYWRGMGGYGGYGGYGGWGYGW